MATKHGLTVRGFALLTILIGPCLVNCGGNVKIGGPGGDAGRNADGGSEQAGPPSEMAGASPPAPDPLAGVPCSAWRPSADDWSSLPASRPAILGPLHAAPSAKYLY